MAGDIPVVKKKPTEQSKGLACFCFGRIVLL